MRNDNVVCRLETGRSPSSTPRTKKSQKCGNKSSPRHCFDFSSICLSAVQPAALPCRLSGSGADLVWLPRGYVHQNLADVHVFGGLIDDGI